MTARITGPTGNLALIRPIDPEFWSEDGNIEVNQYFTEHDAHLKERGEKRGIVYHYTNLEALRGIVRGGAIWASDVRHLNDRAELLYALEHMYMRARKSWGAQKNPQPLDAIFRPGFTGQFVSCFSYSRDQLSQWRAYGRKVGVAIAFDRDHLAHAIELQGGALVDCQYHRPDDFGGLDDEIDLVLRSLACSHVLNGQGELVDMAVQERLTQRVVQIAASIKHPSFDEEQEARAIFRIEAVTDAVQFRSSDQSLTPYISLDIDERKTGWGRSKYANHLGMLEVMVWPSGIDDQILDAIDMLFHQSGHVLISRSSSPYRTSP